ncbi:MFS transporter [Buchnera aphidicola (Aphis helianthi)]|uniref:MFS transporter n=1 Tax=Buchnera aphidicola (Aphis helianthi) TaxID=2315802 RepID=A0A4D6XPL0_9GAMM|nr:MFS transporter [Buchnera aphidicola]QCI17419.1 MFS transporter [Buchnera aphidicola (Aphis helianthi)]
MYIKKNTKKFNQIVLSLFLGGFSSFSILYCVQAILPIFSKQFCLTATESSLSLSATTAMMAIGALFTGVLSDIIGRKLIMSISLLIASVLTIICSTIDHWNMIIFIRALIGLSLSGVVAITITYIVEEVHSNSLSLCIGLYISGNTIGGCSGRILSSMIAEYFSWNVSLFIIGVFSLISSFLFLYFLPSSKNFYPISINYKKFLSNFYSHLKNPILFNLFMLGFLLMGSFVTIFNYIGYRLILKPFLFTPSSIGLLSIIYLTGVYSSPKAGILINKYNKGKILVISLLLMIVGLLITQFNQITTIILGLIIFSGGFFASHSIASSWVSAYAKFAKVQATSLYLFFYYLGSSIFGTFSGYFWFYSKWLGISIFMIIVLICGIFLSLKLKKLN